MPNTFLVPFATARRRDDRQFRALTHGRTDSDDVPKTFYL